MVLDLLHSQLCGVGAGEVEAGQRRKGIQHVTLPLFFHVQVSDEGLKRREMLVLDTCLSQGVPVAGYVGGGYDSDLDVLADRHIWLHHSALHMWNDHGL